MHSPEPDSWESVRPRLEASSRFAFDLEGDFNLYRYGRRICLFQVALESGETFVLDPLEDGPPGPALWPGWKEILENPAVIKVIWAAQNDVRALKACHGTSLKGLWDLFDAACLTVTPRPSLPLLVEKFLGKGIEKSEALQTSDWSTRPLSPEQMDYAAQDVRYLLALADSVAPLLDDRKKRDQFAARMQAAEEYVFTESSEPWRKLKGAGILEAEALIRLEASWRRRDAMARSLDWAPWRLVPNEELVKWAREGRFSENALIDPRWLAE